MNNRPPTFHKKRTKNRTTKRGNDAKLVIFNKPFNTLCQFTGQANENTLAEYIKIKGVYPAGRLDKDSEGLLLLTDNGTLQHEISHPKHKMAKTYWVQVDGEITDEAIKQLQNGIALKDGITKPAIAEKLDPEASSIELWQRTPPVRIRKAIPTSWIALTIKEGKNRQVRRMTASVGFPTLRLIRVSIGHWHLNDLKPGEYREEKPTI